MSVGDVSCLRLLFRQATTPDESPAQASPAMWLVPRSTPQRIFVPWSGRIRPLDPGLSDESTTIAAKLWHPFSSQLVVLRRVKADTDTAEQSETDLLHKLARCTGGDLRTLPKLVHGNLQRLLGVCLHHPGAFVVHDHIDGIPALEFLGQHKAADRRLLVVCVARALTFLHEHNVVHGSVCADHVLVTPDGRVVLAELGSLLVDGPFPPPEQRAWIHAESDPPEPDVPDPLVLQQEDDPTYDWGYRPRRRVGPRDVTADGVVDAAVSSAARASLRSGDAVGDIFALGIMVIEIFAEVEACSSPSSIRLLRMALKAQRPPHPGRVAELRGLDDALWNLCLRSWKVAGLETITMPEFTAAMEVVRDDLVVCPVTWTLEELESWTRRNVRHFDKLNKVEKLPPSRDLDEGVRSMRIHVDVDGREVQAKLISHGILRRLRAKFWPDLYGEIIVWSQMKHPNVFPLIGICMVNRMPMLVIPWIDVGTCNDYLRQNPDADRLAIAEQVAAGLSYLHTRAPAIVHGDVRAHSVVVSSDGVAQISNFDFGPAQDPTESFDKSLSFNEGPLRNSAPDYLNSYGAHRTTWSDVYSFGMFIFELHSTQPPFSEIEEYEDLLDNMKAGRQPDRPNHPQLNDQLWALVLLCWRRRPTSRPTMPQVHRQLIALQSQPDNVHTVPNDPA